MFLNKTDLNIDIFDKNSFMKINRVFKQNKMEYMKLCNLSYDGFCRI